MSLPLLASMVIVGVGLVIVLVHLTGGSTTAVLDTPESVVDHAHEQTELGDIEWCAVDRGGASALLADGQGRLAIALVTGRHVTVHEIGGGDVADCSMTPGDGGASISVKLNDLAWSRIVINLPNSDDAETALGLLNSRMGGAGTEGPKP